MLTGCGTWAPLKLAKLGWLNSELTAVFPSGAGLEPNTSERRSAEVELEFCADNGWWTGGAATTDTGVEVAGGAIV